VTGSGPHDGLRSRAVARGLPRHAVLAAVLATLLATLLFCLAFAPRAHADDETGFEVPRPEERGRAPAVVRGTYQKAAIPQDPAGWGYVRVSLRNVDTRARTITCSVGGDRSGGARLERRLEAGASATVFLPLLPNEDSRVAVDVDGAGSWSMSEWTRFGYARGHRWSVLAVDDRKGAKPALEAAFVAGEAALAKKGRVPGSRTAECSRVAADGLPDRWPLLSFADAIFVDGSRPGLDAERQRILVRALTAGGSLVVLARSKLPPGPLFDLVREDPDVARSTTDPKGPDRDMLGLGRWWASDVPYEVASATGFSLPPSLVTLLEEVIVELDGRPRFDGGTPAGSVPVARFSDGLEIPGIGRLPVRVFFFTILGFALVAGGLSYVLLRRRKRLGAFLVLLPLLGIVFSSVILLYGLLSEGTGIRGSVRSISVLDQRAHEAVTRSGRTLYAAFSPGGLRLDAQTLLLSDDFARASYRRMFGGGTQAILDLDLGDGVRAGGSALPSRVPITYDVTTVAPARERLRFRALPDGRFEARFAPDFAPSPGPRTILLRDADGGWHVGGREGPLTRLEPKDAAGAVRDLLRPVADLPLAEREDEWNEYGSIYRRSGPYAPSTPVSTSVSLAGNARWLRGFLPDSLPPGSYLALFERAPAFDDFGLDVAWKRSVHLVHGLLAAEDLGE